MNTKYQTRKWMNAKHQTRRWMNAKLKRFIPALILIDVILFASLIGFILKKELHLAFRDFIISEIAERQYKDVYLTADDVNYTHDRLISVWGILTNSEYLLNETIKIVPYFKYENVVLETRYPDGVAFLPFTQIRSFHVLGTATCAANEGRRAVVLNIRFLDGRFSKQALLSTLVHELTHIQGWGFCSGESESLESLTSSATLEITAAMCNHGYTDYCSAFWSEVRGMAASASRYRFKQANLEWLYMFLSDLGKNDIEKSRTFKSRVFWSDKQEELDEILRKYELVPWNNFLDGVSIRISKPLVSGSVSWTFGRPEFAFMYFDDSRYILQHSVLFWLPLLY